MKKLSNFLRYLAFAVTGTAMISCTAIPSDWIDVAMPNGVFYQQQFEFSSDLIEIPLLAQQDLEYMVDMKQGGSISYHWKADNLPNPTLLLAEFHGHTIRTSDAPGEVMFYKEGRNESSEGYIVAPFAGIHGWYFSNESSEDINIVLNISGFYSLIEQ